MYTGNDWFEVLIEVIITLIEYNQKVKTEELEPIMQQAKEILKTLENQENP